MTGINETNSLNATNSFHNDTSKSLNTLLILSNTLNSTPYEQPTVNRYFFSLPYDSDEIAGSDTIPINETNALNSSILDNNGSYSSPSSVPISLNTSDFNTYTYGGYTVQEPNSTQFVFSFPDNTNQGQIAGSDALTLNNFSIQKIDFDAAFITPKIDALGFDEMVIFATSDTNTYKGTEFGIRMDLKDGFIYGYIQEPNATLEMLILTCSNSFQTME